MLFKPMPKAGRGALAAQAAPKSSRSLWADRKGQAFVQYALLASVLAAASLMGKPTISTALQNALSTMSLLERALAP